MNVCILYEIKKATYVCVHRHTHAALICTHTRLILAGLVGICFSQKTENSQDESLTVLEDTWVFL